MKFITLIIGLFIINSASGQTNVLESVKQNAATNINQAVIQILAGVKDASGEIYGASKVAIAGAYDFVKKEAPEVVKEFLRWRLVEACIYILIGFSLAGVLFFVARQLKLYSQKNEDDDLMIGKWILRFIAIAIILATINEQGMIIGKILAAPRVYIIEYVVDTVRNHK